jgi:hypothetical protein
MTFGKITLLVILLFLPLTASSQILKWKDKKLTLDDFKGNEFGQDSLAAEATVFIGMQQQFNGTHMVFSIAACFDPSESWMRLPHKNEETLNHEQGHFDITEIFTRKLIREISNRKFLAKDQDEVELLYKATVKEMNDLQIRYDAETKGGTKSIEQKEWLVKIYTLL